MAYNYEWPYVDADQYNNDWLINKVKELASEWAQVEQDWKTEQEAFESLKSFITNYFENLDVQEEINNKLNKMIEDGTMKEIITPIISTYIPPLIVNNVSEMVDKNRLYVLVSSGDVYQWNGSSFSATGLVYNMEMNAFTGGGFITSTNLVFTNADNAPYNRSYLINSNITPDMISNLPLYGARGVLATYSGDNNSGDGVNYFLYEYQTFSTNEHFFYRGKTNTWGEWKDLWRDLGVGGFISNNTNLPFTDADSPILNRIFLINQTITEQDISNLPVYGERGTFVTMSGFEELINFLQIYATPNHFYVRYFGNEASQSLEWVDIANKYPFYKFTTIVQKPYTFSNAPVLWFGDSIVLGTEVEKPYHTLFEELTGCNGMVHAVSGSAYTQTSTGTILDQLQSVTISENDYIFIQAGINDVGAPLTIFETAVKTCFDYISNYAKRVIIITPFNTNSKGYDQIAPYRYIITQQALEHSFSIIDGTKTNFPVNSSEPSKWFIMPAGVHPSELGHRIICNLLSTYLL